ncbi:MAG: hypothetical protein QXT76_03670 [Sulfolobales archaeon]
MHKEVEIAHVDKRIRQLLRYLSELEEKYSIRSSRLLSEQSVVNVLMSRSDEARRDVERWIALYIELTRLRELRSLYASIGKTQ